MKKIVIFGLIVLAVIAYGFAKNYDRSAAFPKANEKVYVSQKYKLSFKYPNSYFLEEKDVESGKETKHEIILTKDTEWNRKIRSGEIADTEGPVSIAIDVYPKGQIATSSRGFITGNTDSNYRLGNGEISATTSNSIEWLLYSWSGLYEGRSLVTETPEFLYMFSVTRLDPNDEILTVFDHVLGTTQIER